MHIDYQGKDVLIAGKGPTQGLNKTTLTAETQYLINFTRPSVNFCLNLHYNGSNTSLFVNATKICQYKAKVSEIKKNPLCLGNISGDFEKTGLNGGVFDFSVDYRAFGTSNIINIHKYLMKKMI